MAHVHKEVKIMISIVKCTPHCNDPCHSKKEKKWRKENKAYVWNSLEDVASKSLKIHVYQFILLHVWYVYWYKLVSFL